MKGQFLWVQLWMEGQQSTWNRL